MDAQQVAVRILKDHTMKQYCCNADRAPCAYPKDCMAKVCRECSGPYGDSLVKWPCDAVVLAQFVKEKDGSG